MRRIAIIAVFCTLAGGALVAQDASTTGTAATKSADSASTGSKEVTLPSGTKYVDITVGTGPVAKKGDRVTVHYVGTLTTGAKFDSSRDRNEPSTFGLNQVIPGWGEGIPGMRVGGRRMLTIPASQAYGSQELPANPPYSGIPANSTLLFDVELLGVQ